MKRILRILAIAAICGILVTPTVEARGSRHSQSQVSNNRGGNRGGGRTGGRANTPSPSRNSTPSRPGNNSSSNRNHGGNHNPGNRPGNNNNNSRPGSDSRPGNNNNRPGNNYPGGNSANRPNDNNRPGNPGGNHNPGNRPGNPGNRPGNGGARPGNNIGRPSHHDHSRPVAHHHHTPPPHRPHYARPWAPPRPPRGWHLGTVYPTFSTVLGISFGSSLDFSLSFLLGSGYNIYSYGNDVVYLNNVNQLNLNWPDASLYYGVNGLDRGEFIYSTSYYDTMRYNDTYARLVAAYGAPVSTTYPSNGMQTCWFGNGGRFVTLQYMPAYGADGVMRYYTTLSFGL